MLFGFAFCDLVPDWRVEFRVTGGERSKAMLCGCLVFLFHIQVGKGIVRGLDFDHGIRNSRTIVQGCRGDAMEFLQWHMCKCQSGYC